MIASTLAILCDILCVGGEYFSGIFLPSGGSLPTHREDFVMAMRARGTRWRRRRCRSGSRRSCFACVLAEDGVTTFRRTCLLFALSRTRRHCTAALLRGRRLSRCAAATPVTRRPDPGSAEAADALEPRGAPTTPPPAAAIRKRRNTLSSRSSTSVPAQPEKLSAQAFCNFRAGAREPCPRNVAPPLRVRAQESKLLGWRPLPKHLSKTLFAPCVWLDGLG